MYIVQWCDHEGNLKERSFVRRKDALVEAEYLQKIYGEEAVQVFRKIENKSSTERG